MAILLRSADDTLSNTEIDENFKTVMGRFTTVASSSTLTLTNLYNRFNVTGTDTITAIADRGNGSGAYGDTVTLHFASAGLQLTDSSTLLLPNNGVAAGNAAAHITTVQGDIAIFQQETSTIWRCISYQRADGSPLIASATSMTLSGDLSVSGHAHFGTKTTVTSASPLVVDFTDGNKQYVNLAHDLSSGTVTLSVDPSGAANVVLQVTTDGTGNVGTSTTWTATGGGTVYWPGGVKPTIAINKRDVISFYFDGADYYGSYLQAYA